MSRYIFLITGFFIGLLHTMYAQQDPMFTRYMLVSDMAVNPSAAAKDGKLKGMVFYRKQWSGLNGSPETMGFSAELPLESVSSGIGVNIMYDKIGFEKHTSMYLNYAYRIPLTQSITLSAGIKGGVSLFNANLTDAITPDPSQTDPVYSSVMSSVVPRAGAGLFLYSQNTYLGLSIPYIFASIPGQGFSFIDDGIFLSRHYYLTAGHVFSLGQSGIQLKPSIFIRYHKAAPVQVDFSGSMWYKDIFGFGLTYRTGDALAAMVDIALSSNIVLSYAYDYTVSDFRSIGRAAHEIILIYQWQKTPVAVPSIHKFPVLQRF
ncbi:MAG: type IX secretion system membrane protein PorP/SprF [Saprospiraceae bacterium]|nr:MAG: membrane protein [Bacteroidetes bacterium OLB9]MCO6463019.1 type IX secretion system membrane protein PorP/SprF [Saprospiraceae bacterium]